MSTVSETGPAVYIDGVQETLQHARPSVVPSPVAAVNTAHSPERCWQLHNNNNHDPGAKVQGSTNVYIAIL